VYALIGPAAAQAGRALWLAFVVAGATAALTAYAYARLGVMRPRASAEFQYTALAFGPGTGFVAGWLMLIADLAAAATVALGFGGYLTHLVGTPAPLNALGLLAAMIVVIAIGVGESVSVAVVLTIVEAAGLLFIVAVGLPGWTGTDYRPAPGALHGVPGAASLIFFAYLGFDELGNFAEEMRRPERDLPRALAVSMVVTTAIYIAVALSAIAVVPPERLAASPAPLALVAGGVLGSWADLMIAVMALAATANTVLLLLLSASRAAYGMAVAGVLPAVLSRVSRTQVPAAATALVIAVVAALVAVTDLGRAAHVTDAAVLLSFVLVNASLVWLAARRRTSGGAWRRCADLGLGATAVASCAGLVAFTGWAALAGVAAMMLAGVLAQPSTWSAARRLLRGEGRV